MVYLDIIAGLLTCKVNLEAYSTCSDSSPPCNFLLPVRNVVTPSSKMVVPLLSVNTSIVSWTYDEASKRSEMDSIYTYEAVTIYRHV